MTRQNVSRARQELPDIVNRAAYAKERTIVSRRGKDVAAIIPIEDLRLLERLAREEVDRLDLEEARAALKEAERTGTLSLEQVRNRLSSGRRPSQRRAGPATPGGKRRNPRPLSGQ